MGVLADWWTESAGGAQRWIQIRARESFEHSPAVVPSESHVIYFFDRVLSHVADQQLAGLSIERESEWISHTDGIDLVGAGSRTEERIGCRRRIWKRSAGVIHVDPENLSEQVVDVLRSI